MFDWMTPTRPPRKPITNSERRGEMLRHDLEERASLLYRLGFSQKRCKARLKANLAWDFELHGQPPPATEIDRVVDAVYRRGGIESSPSV